MIQHAASDPTCWETQGYMKGRWPCQVLGQNALAQVEKAKREREREGYMRNSFSGKNA